MVEKREVLYDVGKAIAHEDQRRALYDPELITNGFEGIERFFPHNIISISQEGLELGNHYHDFEELYFTPNGGLEVKLVDVGHLDDSGENSGLIVPHYDSQKAIEREGKLYFRHSIQMEKGSRLLIPSYVAHRVIGKSGSVLMCWGSVEFDPSRLIGLKDRPELLEALSA